jgi:hypothetical protein
MPTNPNDPVNAGAVENREAARVPQQSAASSKTFLRRRQKGFPTRSEVVVTARIGVLARLTPAQVLHTLTQ